MIACQRNHSVSVADAPVVATDPVSSTHGHGIRIAAQDIKAMQHTTAEKLSSQSMLGMIITIASSLAAQPERSIGASSFVCGRPFFTGSSTLGGQG